MSKLEVRHSVAVGDIGIVWVPDAETEFLAPGGGTTTGEALASLFTPATWATWLQEQGRGVPYEVPELRWFLAEHDVFQRSASRGRPSIVVRLGSARPLLVRLTTATVESSSDDLLELLETLFALGDLPFDDADEMTAGSSGQVPRIKGVSSYFDAKGRHIADKSG